MRSGEMVRHRTLRHFFAGLALGCAATHAGAQAYPNKPILMVVPFPAGVSVTLARTIADEMEAPLGQKIVVEPRPGAGTAIGTKYVIGQPADGYTVLYASSSMAIKSAVLNAPFDARKDVTAIGQLNQPGLVLAVNSNVPAKTARELIDYAKANPGKLNMGTYGPGTSGHLIGALLVHQNGLKVTTVPYSGTVQSALALSQGNSDFAFEVIGSLRPHMQSGRVRILALSLAERDPATPDIPSMPESGVPGFSMSAWSGIVGPAGTPRDAVQRLNAALGVAIRSKRVRDLFTNINLHLSPDVSTPEKFKATIDQDVEVLSRLIREAKLDIE